jgi:hypothetical protein
MLDQCGNEGLKKSNFWPISEKNNKLFVQIFPSAPEGPESSKINSELSRGVTVNNIYYETHWCTWKYDVG